MTRLWFLSTSTLRWLQRVLARLDGFLGLRVAVANELWWRDELDRRVDEAREAWRA